MSRESSFRGNLIALTVVQLSIYLSPLLLLPFLTRILSGEAFGAYAIGLAMYSLLGVLTDYGFTALGPYLISQPNSTSESRSELLSLVQANKATLAIPVSLLPILSALAFPQWREYFLYFVGVSVALCVNALLPIWFFQGIQRGKSILLSTLVARLILILIVVSFVGGDDDLWMASFANALSLFIALGLYVFSLYRLGYRFERTSQASRTELMWQAWPFFLSRAASVVYTSALPILLGLFSGVSQVALFAVADQIYRAVLNMIAPLAQAIYPRAVRSKNIDLALRLAWVSGGAAILVFGGAVVFGGDVLRLVFGAEYVDAAPTLVIFAAALVFTAPSQLLGFPALGALGALDKVNMSVFCGSGLALCLLVAFLLTGHFSMITAAVVVLVVEFTVFIQRVFWLRNLTRYSA